ncbi:MAG: hypothetical protein ACREKM_05525 [Longimicrobiales bacterium]
MHRPYSRFAAAALLLAVAAPASAQLPDAQSLIDRYEQVTGAANDPYAGISSIRTNMNMSSPAQGMAIDMQIDAVLPDKFVMRMTIPGMGEIRSGYDGTVGWSIDPMQGARVLQGPELEQVKSQAANIGSPGLGDDIASAETTGESDVEGKKCWIVKLTQNSGEIADACFDAESGLLLRQTMSQGGVEVESLFQEYKKFGPVLMPSRIIARGAGQEQIITIDSVEYDAVDPAAMALPAEVQALVKK